VSVTTPSICNCANTLVAKNRATIINKVRIIEKFYG
jgi:hypothetical protein